MSYQDAENSASGVLGSSKSSTYPRGYTSGFDSPAALLNELFEHPDAQTIEVLAYHNSFAQPTREGLACRWTVRF